MNKVLYTMERGKRILGAALAVALLSLVSAAHAERCPKTSPQTDPQVRFNKVTPAAPPRPGTTDAILTGNLVTSLGMLFHNSHKYPSSDPDRAVKNFGFGPNVSWLPWIERGEDNTVVLYAADGSPTPFVQGANGYRSKYFSAGDLRTLVPYGTGWVVYEPAGSSTTFAKIAPRGEALPTESRSALGRKSTISYGEGSAVPTAITDPDGQTLRIEDRGTSIVMTDPDRSTITYKKDTQGRIEEILYPDGKKDSIVWDCVTTATDKYNLIVATLDRNGIPTSYTYDVVKDEKNSSILHGVVRMITTTIDSKLINYFPDKTTIEVGETEATFREASDGSRTYDPMGYVELQFASNGQGPWDKYITRVDQGLTPNKTFFAGEVKQDSEGRLLSTTDNYGFTTSYEYNGALPFAITIRNPDGTKVVLSRDERFAYAATQASMFSANNVPIYTQSISYEGIGRPKSIISGPANNPSATSVAISYGSKLPTKVVTTTHSTFATDDKGRPQESSTGNGWSKMSYDSTGYLKRLEGGADPLDFTRTVASNGDLTTTMENTWFSLETTVTLSGTTKRRLNVKNGGGMGRYDFSEPGQESGGVSEASRPVTAEAIEATSSSTSSGTSCECTQTYADGSSHSCDGGTSCSKNPDGSETCNSEKAVDDSRSSDKAGPTCTASGGVPTEKLQCCEGTAPCATVGGKCLAANACPKCVKDAVPKAGEQCCPGTTPCATMGGACLAEKDCPKCAGPCTKNPPMVKGKPLCCSGTKYCPDKKMCVPNGVACQTAAGTYYCLKTNKCIDPTKTSCCGDAQCAGIEQTTKNYCAADCCGDKVCTADPEIKTCTKDCCAGEGQAPLPYCCPGLKTCGAVCIKETAECCAKAGERKDGNKDCCKNTTPPLLPYSSVNNTCLPCTPEGAVPNPGHQCCWANDQNNPQMQPMAGGKCAQCRGEYVRQPSTLPCCPGLVDYGGACQSCAGEGQKPQKPAYGSTAVQNCCVQNPPLTTNAVGVCVKDCAQQGQYAAGRPCCDPTNQKDARDICQPQCATPGQSTQSGKLQCCKEPPGYGPVGGICKKCASQGYPYAGTVCCDGLRQGNSGLCELCGVAGTQCQAKNDCCLGFSCIDGKCK